MKSYARVFGLLFIASVAVSSCKPKQKCAAYSEIPELEVRPAAAATAVAE